VTHDEFDVCIEICSACARACKAFDKDVASSTTAPKGVRAYRDAAILCELFIDDLRGNSPLLVYTARMCARACRQCAKCLDRDNSQVGKRCAAMCRRCAEQCVNVRVWLGTNQLPKTARPVVTDRLSFTVVTPTDQPENRELAHRGRRDNLRVVQSKSTEGGVSGL
jgi:hypothetical protein